MFGKIVKYLSKKGENILWVGLVVLCTEMLLVGAAQPCGSILSRIAKGTSKSAALLMTVDSPSSIDLQGCIGVAATAVGWGVSLFGWLLIPSLIGVLASKAQDVEQSRRNLEFIAFRAAEKLGLKGEAARAYVKELMGDQYE